MDSVRCTKDASHEFTCDVQVDSDFEPPKSEAARSTQSSPASQVPPPASAPPESKPAVSTLVSSFPPNATVYKLPAPPITAAVITECASEELGLVLAAVSKSKSKILTGLAVLKASYDFAQCVQNFQQEGAQRVGENYCHDLGGVVTSVVTGEGPLRVNCKVESSK